MVLPLEDAADNIGCVSTVLYLPVRYLGFATTTKISVAAHCSCDPVNPLQSFEYSLCKRNQSLKKNLNASRPSEHPSVGGESVKTFR